MIEISREIKLANMGKLRGSSRANKKLSKCHDKQRQTII